MEGMEEKTRALSISEKEVYERVFVKGATLKIEEDLLHEFKGHRNFTMNEIPLDAIINRTRRPISRNLCGFLNNGIGGTVYCGVVDDGTIVGICLTEFQKDHVLLSLQDLFSRFDPPVDQSMYGVSFIPVLNKEQLRPDLDLSSQPVDGEQRNQPHTLRTSKFCWCDVDAFAKHELGIITRAYVIEIKIYPWDPTSKLAVTPTTPIHPLFSNEEGHYFIRRHAGLHQPSLAEVVQIAEAETIRYHTRGKNAKKVSQ